MYSSENLRFWPLGAARIRWVLYLYLALDSLIPSTTDGW
jgi:hypothetical protein